MAGLKPRILYSEDDPVSRDIVRLLLNHEGFETVCPPTSRDVLNMAKEEEFDAYLLDSWTPEMSGLELCRRIREFDSQTPIIFFSAAATQGDKDEALAAGAQGYITKPASAEEVMDALRLVIPDSSSSAI